MNRLQLKAERRKIASKGYLKSLRNAGKTPGVLHNRGGESLHISVESSDLKKALHTSAGMNVLLNLEIEDEGIQLARIEDLQYDVLRDGIYTHVDFGRVSLDQKIEVHVPIILIGQEDRAKDDGVISQAEHEVVLLSSPDSIPDNLHADISSLVIGDSIHMKDLVLPEGCEAVTDPDDTIVSIIPPRIVEEAEESETEETDDTEEAAEPELVE